MPDTCAIIGCKVRRKLGTRLFRVPAVRQNVKNPESTKQEARRQQCWFRAINRHIDENNTKNWKVCSKHFISGAPADRTDETNPDWAPSQNLGYISTNLPKKSALARMKRTAERAKRAKPQQNVVPKSHVAEFIKMENAMNESELETQYNFTQLRETLSPVKGEEYLPYSPRPVELQLNDTCRLCLTENIEYPVSIYPSSMLYDNQTTVAHAIEKLISIQVSECDGLPPNICSNCFEALEFIHKFQQSSIESILQLQSMHIQKNPDLHEIFIDQNADAHPEFVDVSKAGNVPNKTIKFKEYSDFESLSLVNTTEKEVKDISNSSNSNRNGRTLCTMCGALIQNTCMERHINKHLGVEPYKCSGCQKSFASQAYLSSHYRDMHTGNKYECTICGIKQSRKAAIRIHMMYHFEPTKPCPICGKKFRFKHQIRKHMMVHTGERPVSCELCPKKCRNKYQLQVHMRVHTKDKPYKCLECDINFTYNYQLKVHKDKWHPQHSLKVEINPVSFNNTALTDYSAVATKCNGSENVPYTK